MIYPLTCSLKHSVKKCGLGTIFGSAITVRRISSAYDVIQKLTLAVPTLGLRHTILRTSRLHIDIVANVVLLPAANVVNHKLALLYIRAIILLAKSNEKN